MVELKNPNVTYSARFAFLFFEILGKKLNHLVSPLFSVCAVFIEKALFVVLVVLFLIPNVALLAVRTCFANRLVCKTEQKYWFRALALKQVFILVLCIDTVVSCHHRMKTGCPNR